MSLRPAEAEISFNEIRATAEDASISLTERRAEVRHLAKELKQRVRDDSTAGPVAILRVRQLLKERITSVLVGGEITAVLNEAYEVLGLA
jgi:hypothetical protein